MALDALLARLAAGGLLRAGGKQRTDSTRVVAAVAALNRLELAGQSVRAAVEALAAACPGWLAQRICVSDWAGRYGTPMTAWRPPASQAKQDELAIAYARDGYALLEASATTRRRPGCASCPRWTYCAARSRGMATVAPHHPQSDHQATYRTRAGHAGCDPPDTHLLPAPGNQRGQPGTGIFTHLNRPPGLA